MTVLKVGFVGLRSDRLDETVALFRDIMGVPVTRQAGDLVGFRLADGTVLELYGPADEFHAFFTTGPVIGFRVDNFDVTRRAMLAAGVRFIGDVQHADQREQRHVCSAPARDSARHPDQLLNTKGTKVFHEGWRAGSDETVARIWLDRHVG